MSQKQPTFRNTAAKRKQHVAPDNVATCCVGTLRSFGRGLTHLDSVKKRRQAGARKAAATRKQESARQKSSDNVATAGNEFWSLCGGPESGNMIVRNEFWCLCGGPESGNMIAGNEFWCLCGGPESGNMIAGNEFWCLCSGSESGNMIACDNPDCPIEWLHFECTGLVDVPSGKWLCTECAVKHFQSYHCSEMLCCDVKFIFLQNLIIHSKFCSDELKENYCLI